MNYANYYNWCAFYCVLQRVLWICGCLGIEPADWLPIGAVFLKLNLVLTFNCTAIESCKANYNAETSLPKMLLGSGLFLATSLMNHSCDPNVYQVTYGTSTVFRAIRPIAKGEQINLCYRKSALDCSYEERQSTLLKDYKFKCR